MELLDRYLQAVRFWLPRAQQQDIIAELSEDLRSQVEEKEAELGRPLDDKELEAIFKRCGSPILVASRYRPQTQLIGPALFPIYQFVLKVVLLWILVPVFIVIVGPAIILPAAHRWSALLQTWSALWSALFVAAGVITLVFAVLERTQAKFQLFEKWDLRSLPPVPKQEQQPSRTQTVFELVFGIIGLFWLLAIPHYPFLILGPAAAFLKPAPMWHSFYLPMVLLALAGVAHQIVSLLRPQWTWFPSLARLITTGLTMIVLYAMLSVAFQGSNGGWHPFVVATATPDPAHSNRLTAIVNLAILVSLASAWLGLSIAGVIQSWECIQQVRKRTPHARDPALLRML
ncbi:MAG: hypothetical protein LAO24_15470 [Acidobacteriia bacterium]|nr:hypothetical protein [Terriglobia bacterium]